jgi:hypothetical protein
MRIKATSKPSNNVILSEAKLQRSPESFRGEARLSISDQLRRTGDINQRCFASLNMTTRLKR